MAGVIRTESRYGVRLWAALHGVYPELDEHCDIRSVFHPLLEWVLPAPIDVYCALRPCGVNPLPPASISALGTTVLCLVRQQDDAPVSALLVVLASPPACLVPYAQIHAVEYSFSLFGLRSQKCLDLSPLSLRALPCPLHLLRRCPSSAAPLQRRGAAVRPLFYGPR